MNNNIKVGADINAGDGEYSESTQERYNEFVKVRNKSLVEGRIKELALQAGLVQGGWSNADLVKIWKEDADNPGSLEKFAELIVRECMSIIKQGEGLGEEDDFDKGFQAGIAMAYNRVRAQMGVEE